MAGTSLEPRHEAQWALHGLLTLLAVLLPAGLAPAQAAADRAAAEFFESRVRPVLVGHCLGCHGPEKQKGGLRLDQRGAVLRGGDTGPAVIPGKPEESLLARAVSYTDDLKMPPRKKLAADQIAALRRWIALGVPWPDSDSASARAAASKPGDPAPAPTLNASPDAPDLWAFRPPVPPPIPAVRHRDWVRSPIDAFVLSKLEANGLAPAPEADRKTLIRRLTFDLTGLPPAPEEITEFLADRSPNAYARLVDRLMASPHYGERWGRHWLDVARYADSNGMDENLAFAHAWRYRDYVVQALNHDLPYDEFVREQIAGDLLPPASDPQRDRQRLAATGFLVLGPKMLAEDDPVKMEMDIIDEQVDSVSKAFLGLTLGCARCHDHKFDPISISDYYGLAGIFKSTKTMEHYRVVAQWNERPLATPAEASAIRDLQARIQAGKTAIDALVKRANDALLAMPRQGDPKKSTLPAKPEEPYPADVRERLRALREEQTGLEARLREYPVAMAVEDRKPVDLPVHIRGSHLTLGAVVPRRFPAVLAGPPEVRIGADGSGRRELARWLTNPAHPLTSRVIVNRVWLWHFGAGLVRSPDNFGRLGERPTHPELLDWLALRFVADGWSLKTLHRRIVLSSTYRMSTAHDPRAAASDPENRLLWHRDRRRLEAEAVRDAILVAGGQLDRTMGGMLLKCANREYVAGTASVNNTNYQSLRRSLYLPVIRSALFDVFQAFDFADPSTGNGQRDVTTVAPQALCLMNSDLVDKASQALAGILLEDRQLDDPARVVQVYTRLLGREPSPSERDRAVAFLDRYARSLQGAGTASPGLEAWAALCRVMFGTSEFLFLE